MLKKLFIQFKSFSRENWWIYVIFLIALFIIVSTGKGEIQEIIFIFTLNIIANLYILLMQDSYMDGHFKRGAIFLLTANILYGGIAIYSAIFSLEYQYLLWQIAFQLSGFKIFVYYHKGWNWNFINQYSMTFLSILFLIIGVYTLDLSNYKIIQSLGFAFTVVGLVQVDDIKRYFIILLGNILVTFGSGLGLYINYISGDIFGVTISFTILSISTLIFYLKLLPIYISRLKIQ